MPLKKGKSRATIQANIAELIASGRTPEQAATIAYKEAGVDSMEQATNDMREIVDRAGLARYYTDEGFLVVPARIARTGIQEYRAFEMGIEDGDPWRVIRVYRSPEEVFDPAAMRSFENKVITDDHPAEFVTSKNARELQRGFVRNVRREGNFLMADLIVTDQELIDKINDGKVELSNGYDSAYDWTPGTSPQGEKFDAQQKNIRGNHVASVDAARCGPACRVSDSKPTPKGKAMADRKVTIDGIPFDLPEAAAAAVDNLIKSRDAAQAASTKAGQDLAAANAAHATALQAKDGEIEKLKKDVMTPEARDAMVEAWAATLDSAKRLVPDLDTKGKTCDAIRRGVITKLHADAAHKPVIDAVLAGRTLESVDGEAVKTIFNVLAASKPAAKSTDTDPVAEALRRKHADKSNDAPEGRSAYVNRLEDAWKTPINSKEQA